MTFEQGFNKVEWVSPGDILRKEYRPEQQGKHPEHAQYAQRTGKKVELQGLSITGRREQQKRWSLRKWGKGQIIKSLVGY